MAKLQANEIAVGVASHKNANYMKFGTYIYRRKAISLYRTNWPTILIDSAHDVQTDMYLSDKDRNKEHAWE